MSKLATVSCKCIIISGRYIMGKIFTKSSGLDAFF